MRYQEHLPPNERRVRWERMTLQDVADELGAAVADREEEDDDEASDER